MAKCYDRTKSSLTGRTKSDVMSAAAQCFLFYEVLERELTQICRRAGIPYRYNPSTANTGYHMGFIQWIKAHPVLCNAFPLDVIEAMERLLRCRNAYKRRASYDVNYPVHPLTRDKYDAALLNCVQEVRANLRAIDLHTANAKLRSSSSQVEWEARLVAFHVDPDNLATLGGTLFRLYVICTEVREHFGLQYLNDNAVYMRRLRSISKKWHRYSPYKAARIVGQWPEKYAPFIMGDVLGACTDIEFLHRIVRDDTSWGSSTLGPTQQGRPYYQRAHITYLQNNGSKGCRSDMFIVLQALKKGKDNGNI